MYIRSGYPTGVPLGGIGSGMIELLTTGKPGLPLINNNWRHPFLQLDGSFFALRAERRGGGSSFKLLQKDSADGYRGAGTVRYTGLFPIAKAQYFYPDFPVRVEVEGFSPLVPHNIDHSSIPAAAFVFRIRNLYRDKAKMNLYVSWENILGIGGPDKYRYENRNGNYIQPFENDRTVGFRCETTQTMADVYPNASGNYAVLTERKDEIKHRVWSWNALTERPQLLKRLADRQDLIDRTLYGIEGVVHPAGVLDLEFSLNAQEEIEIPVTISWFTPHLVPQDAAKAIHEHALDAYAPQYDGNKEQASMNGEGHTTGFVDYGHYYENRFTSSIEAGQYLLQHRNELYRGTSAIHHHMHSADLPDWLSAKIINDSTPLTSNTVLTKDGVLATLEACRGMGGALGTMDQRLISHAAFQLFYPEVNRSELRLFAYVQADDGHIPHFCGNVHIRIGSKDVNYGDTTWPDLSCSFIIQCYRDYLCTGDKSFFDEMLPAIMRAYHWLIESDRDGDGVPEGGSSWDLEHYEGLFIYTGSLWLATLRVMEQIFRLTSDEPAAAKEKRVFDVSRQSVLKLWNGKYFNKVIDYATEQFSDDIFVGQLAGEWVVQLLGLESVLPRDMVLQAAGTVYEYVGDTSRYPVMPNQVNKEGNLVGRDNDHQAWPQYSQIFLDCVALYNGMEQGWKAIEQFDRVIREIAQTPWTTTLWYDARTGLPCGDNVDRYMNTPSAWFILNALSGFHSDEIDLKPIVGPSKMSHLFGKKLPIVSTRYWGTVQTTCMGDQVRIELQINKQFGETVKIRGVRVRDDASDGTFMLNGSAVQAGLKKQGQFSAFSLAASEPLQLKEGDTIHISYRIGKFNLS